MKKQYFFPIICLLAAFGCSDQGYDDIIESEGNVRYSTFDYTTTFECPVSLDLGAKSFVYFYEFDPAEYPDQEYLRSAWTDDAGRYDCIITLPTAKIGECIYASAGDQVLKAQVDRSGASFKGKISRSASDDEEVELQPSQALCKDLRDSYLAKLPRGNGNNDNLNKLVETGDIAVKTLEDDTDVLFSFIWTYAWNSNFVYYYYYKGEDPVTYENRDSYIEKYCTGDKYLCTRGWGVNISNLGGNVVSDTYTNVTTGGIGGVNVNFSTDEMMGVSNPLYFYGENGELTEGTSFPAGYKIGLILKSVDASQRNNLDNISDPENNVRYYFSNPDANPADTSEKHNRVHVGRFWSSHATSDFVNITRYVYGFEDSMFDGPGKDRNFTDFICMVSTNPAANTDGVASFTSTHSSVSGTLLFEDLFPEQGDYDMNDVIVEYRKVKEYERRGNTDYIKNIYVEITPVHNGAQFDDYIYVQCHGKNGAKYPKGKPQLADFQKKMGMPLRWVADYNENQILTSANPKLKTLRLHVMKDYVFYGTTDEDKNLTDANIPDYRIDIFLYVRDTNREVHVRHEADVIHAGIGSQDGLDENQKKYYAMEGDKGFFYPWAMNIPVRSAGIYDRGFIPVTEKVNILKEYLDFGNWVNSNGKSYTDWYLPKNHKPSN